MQVEIAILSTPYQLVKIVKLLPPVQTLKVVQIYMATILEMQTLQIVIITLSILIITISLRIIKIEQIM